MYKIITALLCLIFVCSANAEGVKKYYITCNPADLTEIYENPLEDNYIPISLEYNGKTWTDTEMRIRGDGSRLDPKKSLKVKFNGEEFSNGREKLNFNAEYLDLTYMSSYLSAHVFRQVGVPVFDIEHAAIYINGEFFGLYLRIENVDEQYLEARDIDVKGNLYKATYDGASLAAGDICDENWEKKTNENGNFDDLFALRDSVNAIPSAEIKGFLLRHFDYKNLIDVIATNILLSNASTYYHNYYLYHDINGDGKWMYMPWDMDKTFSHQGYSKDYSYTSHPIRDDNPLIEKCFINDEIFAEVKARVKEISDNVMNEDKLTPVLDSLKNVIKEYVLMDETDQLDGMDDWEKSLDNFKVYFRERINILNLMFDREPEPFEVKTCPADVFDSYTAKWEASSSSKGEVKYKILLHTEKNIVDGNALVIDNITDTQYTFENLEDGTTYYFMVVAEADGKERIGFNDHNVFTYYETKKLPCEIAENMTLTKEGGPYRIECDLTIKEGVVLSIEPGVSVIVEDDNKILVNGKILTYENTQKINFLPAEQDKIFEVHFYGETASILKDVNFRNAGIYINKSAAEFSNCSFSVNNSFIDRQIITADSSSKVDIIDCDFVGDNTSEGVIYKNSSGDVINCYFNGIKDAIEYHDNSKGNVLNCFVQNSIDDGIDLNGSKDVSITKCRFSQISDKAISIGPLGNVASTNISIENIIIDNAASGIAVKDNSTVSILNSDIINCSTAVVTYDALGLGKSDVLIENTIFYENLIDFDNRNESKIDIIYSLSNKVELEGEGNIKADPMFRDAENVNYRLMASSPAIDAGNPSSDNDPDGTRADMGAFPFDQLSAKVVINEIHYNQDDIVLSGDWAELYNNSDQDIDLSGWYFMDSDDTHKFEMPEGTILKARKYLVLVESIADFTVSYTDVDNYIGETGFGFSGKGELLRLYNSKGVLIDMVEYNDKEPWPVEADGDGYTLSLIDPNYDNALPESWYASEYKYGTPGKPNNENKVNEDFANEGFELYPLPAKDYIIFESEDYIDINLVNIKDAFGREITAEVRYNSETSLSIDLSGLSSGIYFITINKEGNLISGSFIVVK